MAVNDKELEKKIQDEFRSVLNWRYNNRNKDSVVITFKDGSQAVYTVDKILKGEVDDKKKSEKQRPVKYHKQSESVNTTFEALTEDDIETLSKFDLTEDEIQHILSLFELISEENKDRTFSIIKSLFQGKTLVPDKTETEKPNKKSSVSERYTAKLLGDI